MASLRRHPLIACAGFLLVLLLGAPLAWLKGKPTYSASAVIFVSPRFIANLQDDKEFDLQSNSQYREYVQQNVRTVNRFDIITEAIERLGDRKSLWIKPGESLTHAAERLQGALSVAPVPDTYQIAVTLEGGHPDGLADIVNSVVNTFLAKSKSEEFFGADRRIQELKIDRDRLAAEVSADQARRAQISQTIGVSTFSEGFPNPYDRLLIDAKQATAEARRVRINAEAQFRSVNPAESGTLQSYAFDTAAKDTSFSSLEANLNLRRSYLLSTLSGLGPDHPGRKAMERELAEQEQERSRALGRLVGDYSKTLLSQRESEVGRAKNVESALQKEVDRQAQSATWFTQQYQEAMNLGQKIERARKRLDSIEDRIAFLSLESRAPGFIRLFSAARTSGEPIKGGRRKLLVYVLAAALIAAIVLPTGVDFLDSRVYLPAEVEGALGMPAMAWIMEKNQAGPEFEAEQILRLASRVAHEHQSHGSRSFAFTSVKAGGGTSTLVLECAAALSRMGVSALAIEANAFKPDRRFRANGSGGLNGLLLHPHRVSEEIIPGSHGNTDRLGVGETDGTRNLQKIKNLVEILASLAEVYSIVLLDAPPVLSSVDAEIVASTADVAVLVVEAGGVTRGDLTRAARQLERIAPKAISVVVNRVRLRLGDKTVSDARARYYSGQQGRG